MVEKLDGRGEIAKRLTELAGVEVSVDQVKRMAQRKQDPLPVEFLGRGKKRRWTGRRDLIDEWARREFEQHSSMHRRLAARQRRVRH